MRREMHEMTQLVAEAQRQWAELTRQMRAARRELTDPAISSTGPAEQDRRSLEAGRDTATAQDAWNTVNGADVMLGHPDCGHHPGR